MRRFVALVVTLFTASTLFAVAPQFWRVRNAEDFLAGDIDGFAVTSRGELRPGPSLKKVATFTDPFVLSQVGAPNGDHFLAPPRQRRQGLPPSRHGVEGDLHRAGARGLCGGVSRRGGVCWKLAERKGLPRRSERRQSDGLLRSEQAYIWAMEFLPNGDLAVATGVDGKLFRVTPKGEEEFLSTRRRRIFAAWR